MPRLPVLLTFVALSACGQATTAINSDATPTKLQNDTASYFGTSRYNVHVSNQKQSVLGTSYQARVSGTLYDCRYFRSAVTCRRAG